MILSVIKKFFFFFFFWVQAYIVSHLPRLRLLVCFFLFKLDIYQKRQCIELGLKSFELFLWFWNWDWLVPQSVSILSFYFLNFFWWVVSILSLERWYYSMKVCSDWQKQYLCNSLEYHFLFPVLHFEFVYIAKSNGILSCSLWLSPPKIIVILIYVPGMGMTRDEFLEPKQPSPKGQYIGELLFWECSTLPFRD